MISQHLRLWHVFPLSDCEPLSLFTGYTAMAKYNCEPGSRFRGYTTNTKHNCEPVSRFNVHKIIDKPFVSNYLCFRGYTQNDKYNCETVFLCQGYTTNAKHNCEPIYQLMGYETIGKSVKGKDNKCPAQLIIELWQLYSHYPTICSCDRGTCYQVCMHGDTRSKDTHQCE